ncbi:MAG: spore coat protein [Bacillota bacterium]
MLFRIRQNLSKGGKRMLLDDKDILADILADAKYCSTNYHKAALESQNDQIRNTFIRLMNDELASAKMIFDAMHQRGWYPVDMAKTAPGMQQYAAPGAGFQPQFNPQPGPRQWGAQPGMHQEYAPQPGSRPEYAHRPEAGFGRPEAEPHRW